MKEETKARRVADLLVGETRFDINRKPSNIEVSAIAALTGQVSPDVRLALLSSSTEEAAQVKLKESESVSVISSIIAATAVGFPSDVMVTTPPVSPEKLPPFLAALNEIKGRLNQDSKIYFAEPSFIRQRWHWGVSVGMLQLLRWVEPADLGTDKPVVTSYWHSICDTLTPFFISLVSSSNVQPMPDSIKARSAEIIVDLAKNRNSQFETLVRQIAQRNGGSNRGLLRLSQFGSQLCAELRSRYWFTRSAGEQDKMIRES